VSTVRHARNGSAAPGTHLDAPVMARRGRKRGPVGEDEGLLELTFTQLWLLAGALGMSPSDLAERIDPAVREAQRDREKRTR